MRNNNCQYTQKVALIQTRRFEVTVFAGVLYTGLKIHVPDDYGFVTAGTVAGVPHHASPGLKLVPLGTMRQVPAPSCTDDLAVSEIKMQ